MLGAYSMVIGDEMKRIVVIVMLCMAAQPIMAAPRVSVEPAHLNVWHGDEFTVNITVDPDGNEVMGAQYYLYFNNTLLNGIVQNQGTFLNSAGPPIRNEIHAGWTEYGEYRTGVGVTDPGVLASIRFEVIGNSGFSELRLDDVVLSDPDAHEIPDVNINNGHVAIAQPPTPFLICGYVAHKNGSGCDDPRVNITNLNTSQEWKTDTNASESYYQIMLAHSNDIVAGGTLQFTAIAPDGGLSNTTDHYATLEDIHDGGLSINVTLDRKCGDVDGNGIINILDVRLLSNHVSNGYSINEWAGDVDRDHDIDCDDVRSLLWHVFNPGGHSLNCCQ